MTGQLQTHGDGGGFYHCVICGGDAAGPCARCKNPVCGDCCVLVEGTSSKWAICLRCERRGGRNAGAGWITVAMWLILPLLALGLLLFALYAVFGSP